MGNAEPGRDVARVMNVLAGAAGALAVDRLAVVVELQGDADDVVALARHHRGDDRGIDAARHRHDDARLFGRLGEAEAVSRGARRRRLAQAFDLVPARPPGLSPNWAFRPSCKSKTNSASAASFAAPEIRPVRTGHAAEIRRANL